MIQMMKPLKQTTVDSLMATTVHSIDFISRVESKDLFTSRLHKIFCTSIDPCVFVIGGNS